VAILRAAANDQRRAMEGIRPGDYNPFNLLVMDGQRTLVGHGAGGERLEIVELQPGTHLLCVHDVDDAGHAKEVRIREHLDQALSGVRLADACVEAMTTLLRDHGTNSHDGRDAVCIHGDKYGTVSASLVTSIAGRTLTYRHAAGKPCIHDFADVPLR
jgi:hypothetical protein